MFGTPDRDKIYIASADFMTRNTLRRVEVATPIYDDKIKQRIRDMFGLMMKDNMQACIQQPDGTYLKQNRDVEEINSQEIQYADAYERARQ
jgi:polyphosphate kinase